jgi:hypothetical protein
MFFYRICTVVTIDTIGAVARGAVLTFFVVSVAVYAARHGVHGFGGHAFLPSYAVFIAVVPVLFFNYAGGKTRRETAAEPVVPAYVPADSPGRAS